MRILIHLFALSCALYVSEANYPGPPPPSVPVKPVVLPPAAGPAPIISGPRSPGSDHRILLYGAQVPPAPRPIAVVAETVPSAAGVEIVQAPVLTQLKTETVSSAAGFGIVQTPVITQPKPIPALSAAVASSGVIGTPSSPLQSVVATTGYDAGTALVQPSSASIASAAVAAAATAGVSQGYPVSNTVPVSSRAVSATAGITGGAVPPYSTSSSAAPSSSAPSGISVQPDFVSVIPAMGTPMGVANLQSVRIFKSASGPKSAIFQSSGRPLTFGSSVRARSFGPNGPLTRISPGDTILTRSYVPIDNFGRGGRSLTDMTITDVGITSPRVSGMPASYPGAPLSMGLQHGIMRGFSNTGRTGGLGQISQTVHRQSLPVLQGTYYAGIPSTDAAIGSSTSATTSAGRYATWNDYLAYFEGGRPLPGPLNPIVIRKIQSDPVLSSMFADLTRLGKQYGLDSIVGTEFSGGNVASPGRITQTGVVPGLVGGDITRSSVPQTSVSARFGGMSAPAFVQTVPGVLQFPQRQVRSKTTRIVAGAASSSALPLGNYGSTLHMRGTDPTRTSGVTFGTGTAIQGRGGQQVSVSKGTQPGVTSTNKITTGLTGIGRTVAARTASTATGGITRPITGGRLIGLAQIRGIHGGSRRTTGSNAARSFQTIGAQQRWVNLRTWTTTRLHQMAAVLAKDKAAAVLLQWNKLRQRIDAAVFGGAGTYSGQLRNIVASAMSSTAAGAATSVNALLGKTLSIGLGGAAFETRPRNRNTWFQRAIVAALAARGNGIGGGFGTGASKSTGGFGTFGTRKGLDFDVNDDNDFDDSSSSDDDDNLIPLGFMGADEGFGDWDF